MKTPFLSLLFVLACGPLMITGCGGESGTLSSGGGGGTTGGSGGAAGGTGGATGGTGGTTGVIPHGADPKYVAGCELLCTTYGQVGCSAGFDVEACKSTCAQNAAHLDGLCTPESVAYFQCASKADYVCTPDGNVTTADGKIACEAELIKANRCQVYYTCGQFCRMATEVGCGAESQEACVAVCGADQDATDHCSTEYQSLRYCQSQAMACENGKPAPAGCDAERGSLVTCLTDQPIDDPCILPCWEGGGECDTGSMLDCAAKCQTARTAGAVDAFGCDAELADLNACRTSDLTCDAGEPVFNAAPCDAQVKAAAACYADTTSPCSALCWYEGLSGCLDGTESACVASCEAVESSVPACAYDHGVLLQCQVQQGIACTPASPGCESEQQTYDTCLANN